MTTSTKFLKHFRDLQAGESEKAGAAETLAYLNGSREFYRIETSHFVFFVSGELSFQEYEKRVREANTDYSHVNVGKVLNTREPEIVDIDKLIDELSDIDDLSGLSSEGDSDDSTSGNSDESLSKKKTNDDTEPKVKRRRRKKNLDNSDNESESDREKISDPTELRNKMVQHLEQMRLANQKARKKKGKRSTARKRQPITTGEKLPKSRLNQEYQALMGEANMAYVHGDIPKAIRICQEVITNVPNAAEPYLTIARIYEDQNEHEKAFEVNSNV